MGALKDPNASYTVDNNYYGQKSAKSGTDNTSVKATVVPQAFMGKSYPNGRYAMFVGNISTLTEGKTVTVSMTVNGELKAQQTYSSKGFIADSDNDKTPPQANVSDLDEIAITISTNDATDIFIDGCKVVIIAGQVTPQLS